MKVATALLGIASTVLACGGGDPLAGGDGPGGSAAGGDEGTTATAGSGGDGSTSSSGAGADSAGGEGGMPSDVIGLDCGNAADTLLCDDFESGAIDDSLWSVVTQNGAEVTVDDTVVLDGDYALHVTLPSSNATEGALRAKDFLFPLPDNSMYGRVFIHVGPAVPDTHSKAITLRGPLDGQNAQYRLDCNGGDFNSRYYTPAIDQNIQHGGLRKFGYEAPTETWLCVEWHYDGTNHEMRYWFDGEAVDDMTVLETEDPQWTAPSFDVFDIGWRTYQAGKTADEYHIHYDALVIDDERIGCGQ